MDARGDQATTLQDFNRTGARGEGASEASEALLDREDRRARQVNVASEGDITTREASALDADVQRARQTRDGVGDGDGVGTGEGQLTAVKEDGSGGAEGAGDGFGAVIEVRFNEVTADVEDAVIDAVGAAEGIVSKDVEVRAAVLHDHTRTRDCAEVTDIARLAHGRVAVHREVSVPAQDTRLVFEEGAVVQADDGIITRREVPGEERGATVDVDRLTTETTEGRARLKSERTTRDLDVTRVDNRVVADDDQLAGEQLPNGVDGPVARLRGK